MKARVHDTITSICEKQWQQLVDDGSPFHDYRFLKALETSDCLGHRTGWHPSYVTIIDGELLVGASCVYLRTNSYGEYIFDWSWAEAYQRYGFDYYPKLTVAVPFTPATGARLLVHPQAQPTPVKQALIGATLSLADQAKCSSLHYLFIPAAEVPEYEEADFSIRHSVQFHWENHGYNGFDDFLATLKRKKRREILRERQSIVDEHLDIEVLSGTALTAAHADVMYEFYLTTVDRKYASDYLTREFFQTLFETMPDRVVLILAGRAGKWFAGAIHFRSDTTLYGRYWGCTEHVRFLHFELCYYQAIEYAIDQGLSFVEAGAQGPHKIQRGYSPVVTRSAHWLREGPLAEAIRNFIEEEKRQIEQGLANDDNYAYKPELVHCDLRNTLSADIERNNDTIGEI
jgi:predicted N-acyltransferase